MSEDYQSVLEEKCDWKGVLTREKCVRCEGYDPQCPDKIDKVISEEEIIDRYNKIKE